MLSSGGEEHIPLTFFPSGDGGSWPTSAMSPLAERAGSSPGHAGAELGGKRSPSLDIYTQLLGKAACT